MLRESFVLLNSCFKKRNTIIIVNPFEHSLLLENTLMMAKKNEESINPKKGISFFSHIIRRAIKFNLFLKKSFYIGYIIEINYLDKTFFSFTFADVNNSNM